MLKKNRLFRTLLLGITFLLISFTSLGSHVAGGYIQLECTGTPGQYIVRLVLYRDCSGISAPTSPYVAFSNNCGLGNFTAYLNQVSSQEVSQICPQQLGNTQCEGGSLPGYEEYIYEATVSLGDCDTWTASYSLCCRNGVNNVASATGTSFIAQSQFNTQTSNCNESPTVTAQPEPFVCLNQPVSYNLGAYEGDGDSIAYALVPALSSTTGNNVNYNGGYSGTSPIPGVTIDPITGTVTYTPTQTGPYIFVIQMTEYDANGNVISVTNYEYQTYVENCNNTPPQPPSATPGGGITNVTGSIVQNGPNSLTLCQGNQGCFDVVFTDPDPGDVLTVQSNLASVLPGASITQSGTNPLTVTVCWSPTSTQGTVGLNFLVEDDACPLVGQNNYAASINVTNPGVANVSTTTETCGGTNEGTATISITGNPGPFTYNIDNQSGPTTASNSTGQFTNLEPGTYDYTVQTPGGCELQGTFTIVAGPPMPVTPSGVDVSCNGGNDGSATITPNGGTAPYIYVWSQGGSSIGQNTQTASNLTAGTYDVLVTDANGCEATSQVVVSEPTALAGNLTPTDVLCEGDCNGEVDVNGVSGGTTPYQYNIDGGANQGGTNFNGLCPGAHQVVITDDNGCTLPLNTNVGEPAELVLTIDNVVDASCGTNSGSIEVSAAGGTTNYTFTIGGSSQTGNNLTFNNLAPNTHTVTITDANGCTDQTTATVGAVAAPTAFVDNLDNVGCLGGNNGEVVIGTTGTIAPVTYSLNGGAGQASNTFSNLTAGNYTVDITDGNGCTATTNFTINEPTLLTFNQTVQDASCNGVCDAEIDVNASGGTPPYQYSSDGGAIYQSSNVLTGLCAANSPIAVVVQDDNGCITNFNVAVNEPAALNVNTNPTDPICEGGCDGEIGLVANGGTTPYQYNIDGGAFQTNSTFTGLCADSYDLIVEDANGCQFPITETLNDPPGITIDSIDSSPSNCGFNDGMLEVQGVGVNPPFQYSANGGPNQASGVFSNLFAGAYNITVTDALGCQESVFFGVNDIQMDGQLVDTTSVSCFGGSDGDVEVINLAGSAPISFELDNSGTTQNNGIFTGLSAGSHIVTIYDAGFCIYTVPFTLLEPDEINFSTNVTDIACNGGATGEIEFTNLVGGTGAYQYSIDGGFTFQASPTFNGLTQGSYNLVVIDANNCSQTGSATINQATPIAIDSSVTNLACNNDGTGVIQIIASGGAGNYSYSIDNGGTFQSSAFFVNLQAGTYDLVVEDGAGCQMTNTAIVSEPTPLAANYTPTDALCFGSCDGEMDIVANGGTPPYLYSIDNGTTFTSSTNITGICASTFTVVVEDDNGCSVNSSQTVNEPTQVTFNSVETPSTCGNPNGEITITANGGTPGYTYSNDNGSTFVAGNNFTGLAAGTYDLMVEDQNGCPASGQQTVTNEASPVIDFINTQDPSCNGVADGEAVVTVSGGTGTILYSIDGGATQASNTITGIGAGNHTIEVVDDNGCTDTENITLVDPPLLTFNTNITDLTCFQNSTGAINVVPNGGTPPYEYSFDNGASYSSSPNNNFINAGTYDIIVEDANECQDAAQATVNEPPLLEFDNITAVDATCNGYCDGEITLDVIGGTGAYSYTWTQGVAGNVNTATGLCTGNYDFVVEDANGCQIFDDVLIDEPAPMTITSIIESNVVCNGNCDGSIEINSPTGAQFSIDGGVTFQASNIFNNLCDGTYPIQVQDAAGCMIDSSADIWQPDPLTVTTRPSNTVCYGIEDTLYANGVGGIQPYTFQWSNGPTTYDNPLVDTLTDTYTVTITDVNGCTATSTPTTITVIPRVQISVSADTTICPGGTATLTAVGSDGQSPYSYSWDNGQNGATISVSPSVATTYTATVTDMCGHDESESVDVSIHTLPQVDIVGDQLEGCAPLDVQFTNNTPAGQIGANCSWTIEGNVYPGCAGPNHIFDEPGCYDVTLQVTSPDGCTRDSIFDNYICVHPDPVANFYFDPARPTITDNLVNFYNTSTGAANYNWNFQAFGSSTEVNPTQDFMGAEPEDEINVCLEAISAHGCMDETCKPVIIYDDFVIFVPNAFTPDFDEFNQTFLPVMPPTADILEYQLMIFNRWGEPIFESHNPGVGWDGTYRGEIAKDEVYVWQIILIEGTEETKRTYRGHVTLLK